MKILVLGANGNLGTQISEVFEADSENEVIAWDREQIDVTDEELVYKKISDIKPEIIINAVAYNAVDKCEESEEEYDKAKILNIDVPRFLANAAIENDALLIHFSSDYVFGAVEKDFYEESDEPSALNRYGKTKLHGERAIIKLSSKGLKWYLIRTSKLFGPKGSSEVTKMSFFDLIFSLSSERDSFDMVDGEFSCFTYTKDLAKKTKLLVDEKKGYGIYHIVNEGVASWYDGAVELFHLKGVEKKLNKVKSEELNRLAKRANSSVLKNTKLEPLRSWKEALREYLNI